MGQQYRVSDNYVLKNIYRIDNSGNASIVSEHRYGDNMSMQAEVKRNADGSESINANGKWKLDSESSVMLKLVNLDSPGEEVWITYERRL